jgi:hypothetical protein
MNRIGWEEIWNSDHIPDRFVSFAAPNDTVVDWANSLRPGVFVFDLGCGGDSIERQRAEHHVQRGHGNSRITCGQLPSRR